MEIRSLSLLFLSRLRSFDNVHIGEIRILGNQRKEKREAGEDGNQR